MQINIPDELLNDEEKKNTALRFARFMAEWANNREDFKFTMFQNPHYNQMVILRDCEFASLCAHHILPFHGTAHIGYIPSKLICGISKIARTVDMFASKPQTQEKLTEEIAAFLENNLKPKGLMVVLEAAHDCMRIRGVKKQNSVMVTSAIRGVFEEKDTRDEFLRLIK